MLRVFVFFPKSFINANAASNIDAYCVRARDFSMRKVPCLSLRCYLAFVELVYYRQSLLDLVPYNNLNLQLHEP